ncbi:MAG: sulfatase/phosphatase domain-containing protein, partial [Planctomycetaceae bacterium]
SFASLGTTGGHRGRKRSLLQGGIGVPFIAGWPGKIASGKIDDSTPMTAVDLLPTLCAIADVELPEAYIADGVDQSAALFGKPASNRRKPIFWQWKSASKRGENWPTLAVRTGQWKLLLGKSPGQVELFHFPDDRHEKYNRQHSEADTVKRLKSLIANWEVECAGVAGQACFSTARPK